MTLEHVSVKYRFEYVDGDVKDTIKDESEEGEVSHFQALTAALSGNSWER